MSAYRKLALVWHPDKPPHRTRDTLKNNKLVNFSKQPKLMRLCEMKKKEKFMT